MSRAAGSATFPACFTLVAAMNPCACGYAGDPRHACQCSPGSILRYRQRVSGPLLDRIDLHVSVPPISPRALLAADSAQGEPSAAVRVRVVAARSRQAARFGVTTRTNASVRVAELKQWCALTPETKAILETAAERLALSARGVHRVVRIARTIADLAGDERVGVPHVAEALQYRAPFSDL